MERSADRQNDKTEHERRPPNRAETPKREHDYDYDTDPKCADIHTGAAFIYRLAADPERSDRRLRQRQRSGGSPRECG